MVSSQRLKPTVLIKSAIKLLVSSSILAVLCLILIFEIVSRKIQNTPSSHQSTEQVSTTSIQKANVGMPKRLRIPSIDVDAAIEFVGVTPNGMMDIPKSIDNAGWLNIGPKPGENGSAVIAGHFQGDWNQDGVFSNLNKLKYGDHVSVEDDGGVTTTFVVSGIQIYDPGFVPKVFNNPQYGIFLNLVTCDGIWDEDKKSFSKRLVVFTEIAP